MDQSPTFDEKIQKDVQASHEQRVSFQNPAQHHLEQITQNKHDDVDDEYYDEDEEEEIDEDEDESEFERRLSAAQQRNQDERLNVVSASSPLSPPDSMDSGDFVKLEKPLGLFSSPHRVQNVKISVQNKEEEITPSDDVAEPIGEDMRDFAPSPQDAAHGLADRTHETLEQFLASSGQSSGRAERDFASTMDQFDEPTSHGRRNVAFEEEDTFEDTFRREGPLTVGQQVTETNLRFEPNSGLVDGSESPTLAQQVKVAADDAAAAVGEFASKITRDAKEGAFKAKELFEHGALQTKEAVEDLLGLEEDVSPASISPERTPPGNLSIDQPETPIILASVRPPTPPKPRAADAPETPPILDLGGPGHPHTQPYSPYQRKPSLKMTPTPIGLTSTGLIPGGSAGSAKLPLLLDIRRWDRNVLDLLYWRDVKKSGIVFGVTLALLLCLATFNIITVVSYLSLVVLASTFSYRVYNSVTSAVQKTEAKNPFQPYLERSLDLPQDRLHEQVDVVLKQAKDLIHQLRRLFFVEDFCDTLKFALLLWALTYVGAYFSATALTILAFVGLFTLPKVYELYQPQIDQYYGVVESKVQQASAVAREQLDKVPFFKKQKPPAKEE